MTILLFFIILGVLVFVHEVGHFLAAKKAGVQVDEFGFGYPPRAAVLGKKWGTLFTLNWVPFGGFVKILGEDYEEAGGGGEGGGVNPPTRFTQISKKWQAAILAAGVAFNLLFAWLLFSLGFLIGIPTPVDNNFGGEVKNPVLMITAVVSGSPADMAGLKTGDKIDKVFLPNGTEAALTAEGVSDFIDKSAGEVAIQINRSGKILNFEILPTAEIIEGQKVIGISMDTVGTLSLPVHEAIYQGGKVTIEITRLTIFGIAGLLKDAARGQADLSSISGPVGIVGLVGDASRLGFAYLITFTALISINLAIINFLPFPALDGGRIIFVAIEGITKKNINPKIAGAVNGVGFALLIILMLFITYRDILRLF